MEKLEALSAITRLSERIIRVLGQNPGKFTLQGTNTYIIGRRNPYILVDTGEGKKSYIPFLKEALQTTDPSQQLISDIVLTHRHSDHTHGLPSVLALIKQLWTGDVAEFRPPRIHKYPLTPKDDRDLQVALNVTSDLYLPAKDGGLFHQLTQSQILHGTDSVLNVIHTPGHTVDSICLYMPEEQVLFSADTVLGQGTAVFEDLAAYISSLRFLLSCGEQAVTSFTVIHPGHGPAVENGPQLIREYIKHRMEREVQIVQVLSSPPSSGAAWSLWDLVANIYADYPQSLWTPAAGSIYLHLMKLKGENRIQHVAGEGKDSRWILASKL
ncbi:beta-lactamase-like protein [Hysterangium stoloniferum]|nr:beta-lactamase-like protein [Hysterangium stoloniferum]